MAKVNKGEWQRLMATATDEAGRQRGVTKLDPKGDDKGEGQMRVAKVHGKGEWQRWATKAGNNGG